MTSQPDVIELIRQANPVSEHESSGPDERDLLVMEQIIRSSIVPPRVDEDLLPRWRRLLDPLPDPAVALASFLAVAAVGLTLWLLSPGGPFRDDPATSGPITDVSAVGAMWESAINDGDLERLASLYANPVAHEDFLAGQIVFGATYALSDCTATDNRVTCTWTSSSELLTAIGTEGATGSMSFTVVDGYVVAFDQTATGTDWDRALRFFVWVEETHPELIPQITEDRGPAGDQLRSELVGEWVGMGIVSDWQRAINAGDLDGLMALHAEGLRWANTDLEGFREFFGWRIGLNATYAITDCAPDGSQVACRWSTSDDFFATAGVDSLIGDITFVIDQGLIVELIDVPDETSAADWDRVLMAFDAWVRDSHPELIEPGQHGFMRFTPNAAAQQLELVQEWVASR